MLTHHAYLIQGNRQVFDAIQSYITSYTGLSLSHPDIALHDFGGEKLKVDDSHAIQASIQKRPVSSSHTYTLIYAHTITEQAQNALLKICEEPPITSKIFLITDYTPAILPTLASRFVSPESELATYLADIEARLLSARADTETRAAAQDAPESLQTKVKKTKQASKTLVLDPRTFLTGGISERLSFIKQIHTALDAKRLVIHDVWQYINGIEDLVRHKHQTILMQGGAVQITGKLAKEIPVTKQTVLSEASGELEVLARVQQYAHIPGNSIKMLLEYIAIHIGRIV
jgi:hypothetical protein